MHARAGAEAFAGGLLAPRHYPPHATGERKPKPGLLLEIIREAGACPEPAVYVGDSLMKDVAMAQAADVADVHAAYGLSIMRMLRAAAPRHALVRRGGRTREGDRRAGRDRTGLGLGDTFSELLQ